MLKIENCIYPSSEQILFVIQGMRNPKNSWNRSDSYDYGRWSTDFHIGENDLKLMQTLRDAGPEHRKYMRMMPIYARVTAPLYWLKEFDTYKIGTASNSCSTMHKIAAKEFTLDDFSHEHLRPDAKKSLAETCAVLNDNRKRYLETNDKEDWWQLIQLLPSSYNQTRNIMLNYEVAMNIYRQRKNHRLDEWHTFCDWLKELPYIDITDETI